MSTLSSSWVHETQDSCPSTAHVRCIYLCKHTPTRRVISVPVTFPSIISAHDYGTAWYPQVLTFTTNQSCHQIHVYDYFYISFGERAHPSPTHPPYRQAALGILTTHKQVTLPFCHRSKGIVSSWRDRLCVYCLPCSLTDSSKSS